jgi:hypothetical protein
MMSTIAYLVCSNSLSFRTLHEQLSYVGVQKLTPTGVYYFLVYDDGSIVLRIFICPDCDVLCVFIVSANLSRWSPNK